MSTRLDFYRTPERQAAIGAEVATWIGTPFTENAAIKGPHGGVSCVRFPAAVHAACGAIPPVEIPALPVEVVTHWHEHQAGSKILEFFRQPHVRERVRVVDEAESFLPGDMIVVKLEQTEHHLMLVCSPVAVAHVSRLAGVVTHSLRDPKLRKLIRHRYRISEQAHV